MFAVARLFTEGERGLLPNKCPHGDNKVISFCPVGARWSISIVLWPVCLCPSRVQAILAYTAGYPRSKILETSLPWQEQFALVIITPKTNTGTVLIVQVCVVNFANGRCFTKWTAVRQRLRKLASFIIICPAGINKLQDKHGLQKTNSVSHWSLEYRLFRMSLPGFEHSSINSPRQSNTVLFIALCTPCNIPAKVGSVT